MLCMPVYWLVGVEKNRPAFSFFLPLPRLLVSLGVHSLVLLELLGLGGDCVQRPALCSASQPGSGCMALWMPLPSFCLTAVPLPWAPGAGLGSSRAEEPAGGADAWEGLALFCN